MMRRWAFLIFLLASACTNRERAKESVPHEPQSLPSTAAADSLLARYLSYIVERDGRRIEELSGIESTATPCVEEQYGDSFSSYWLARGKVLGYTRVADTLLAKLQLLTVAVQEPSHHVAEVSVVNARIRTDTLSIKLIPDAGRTSWQICGLLSDYHTLGAYGRPDNVEYEPAGVSRATLLAQIDSIQRAAGKQ